MKNKPFYLLLVFSIYFVACKKTTNNATDDTIRVPPTTPIDTNLALGNPSKATADEGDNTNYLMKGYYTLSYNSDRGIPNWVSWHLESSDLGTFSRQNDFRLNPKLPQSWYKIDSYTYSNTGFDRGHICPSSDRTATLEANSATFLMTNIIPQAPKNNQGPWATLETYARTLVQDGNELYIIAGAYGQGGVGDQGAANTIDNGRITVPANLWKVILVLPKGTGDLLRIKSDTRVISVVMPNRNDVNPDWRAMRTSVDLIEQATGYDIFSNVNSTIQAAIESKVDTQ